MYFLQFIDGTMRLSHLFCCINSASNFIIYYFNGTKFRQAWCEIYSSPFQYCGPSEDSNNVFRSENLPTATVHNILRGKLLLHTWGKWAVTVGWGTKAQCFCLPYLKTWFFYIVFNAELNGTIRILCLRHAIIDLLWPSRATVGQ